MRDKDYEVLLNKYNMVVAQNKEMTEQIKRKDNVQAQYEKETEIVLGHARKLCEKILAKNPQEMVLGDARTWHTFSTDELILKATKGFDWYVKDRTDVLSKIMAISEQRGLQIESLKDQISQTIIHGNIAQASSTVEDFVKKAEEEAQKKKVLEKTDNSIKTAAEAGNVKLIVQEFTDDDIEMEEIKRQMEVAEVVKTTPKSVPVGRCQEQVDKLKNEKGKVVQSHLIDLNKIIEKRTEEEWNVLEAIGGYGKSKFTDIQQKVLENNNVSQSKVRTSCLKLLNVGAIESLSFVLPLSTAVKFYKLTDIGVRLYKAKFEKDPIESDLEKVIKEHSSAEHGYGILDVQNTLINSSKYKEVIGFNRHTPINVNIDGQKLQYIPDIVCTDKNGYKTYIEYEMNTSNQSDFNEKCNKMSRVMKKLVFVIPNKTELEKIKKKIDKWIDTRGARNLKGYQIFVYTASNIKKNEPAPVEYDLSKGANPIRCELK